jgi:Cu/Ag efflux protein CusF
MKTLHVCILVSLVTVAPILAAQPTQSSGTVTTAPGSGKATQTQRTKATVTSVDPATRTVSLKRADGQIVEIQAGQEVRNFDKIKAGDIVNVEYTQALSIDVKKGAVGAAKRHETVELSRAPVGAQPGATVGSKVTVLADVIAVNKQDQVITLRGPHGNVVDLKVQDPAQLTRVKQGDQVQAVYTEAMAIAVEPSAPPPARK